MIIQLFKNYSDSNVVDKSLSDSITYDGNLRDGCSVIDPTILIQHENLSLYNYLYIPSFNRYYYITAIENVRTNLWAISCHVDVLMTYKAQFRNLSGVIARQETKGNYNLFLPDDRLLVTSRRNIFNIKFPNQISPASSGPSFVLTVAGGPTTSSS